VRSVIVTTTKMIVIGTLQDVTETITVTATLTTASVSVVNVTVDTTRTKTMNAVIASDVTATKRRKPSAKKGVKGDEREMRETPESMMIVGVPEITVIGNVTGRGRATARTARARPTDPGGR